MGFRRKWGQLHSVPEEEQEERGQEKGSLRSGPWGSPLGLYTTLVGRAIT